MLRVWKGGESGECTGEEEGVVRSGFVMKPCAEYVVWDPMNELMISL
jgi:hypothetical protein